MHTDIIIIIKATYAIIKIKKLELLSNKKTNIFEKQILKKYFNQSQIRYLNKKPNTKYTKTWHLPVAPKTTQNSPYKTNRNNLF